MLTEKKNKHTHVDSNKEKIVTFKEKGGRRKRYRRQDYNYVDQLKGRPSDMISTAILHEKNKHTEKKNEKQNKTKMMRKQITT